EEAPATVVAEPTEVVVEEAPAIEAATTGGAEATKKPAPRKKAAPKAKAEKSSANADADQAPVDGSDDTAEEE
ncbi:MAG: DUF5606 domain-containing protein, partial [Acidimicrobiia bacterium]